LDQV
jgi:hypothetical protein